MNVESVRLKKGGKVLHQQKLDRPRTMGQIMAAVKQQFKVVELKIVGKEARFKVTNKVAA
jgi:hypothetical protein